MKAFAAALLIATAPLCAPHAALAQAQTQAQRQVLNVQNADIRAFIQDVARSVGRTFIIDPRVTGTVTVASDEPLTRAEMLEVLISTLRANGYVAVPTGSGAYRVVPADGAAQQPGSAGGASYGFSTEIFRLRSVDAARLAETLKPLISANAVVSATQGNALVVADYADNLRRIRDLINRLDQDRATVVTVGLKNSSAREMAEVLGKLTDGGEGRTGVVAVIPVDSSNSLLLRGDAITVQRYRTIAEDLDQRAQSTGDVRVIHLQHASAEQLLPVLQQLVGQATDAPTPSSARPATAATGSTSAPTPALAAGPGRPRAVVARYPGANAVVLSGDAETLKTLSEVVRQLDTRREQVLVEAIVVEVSDQAAKELGVQFAISGRNGSRVPFGATNFSGSAPGILGLAGALAADTDNTYYTPGTDPKSLAAQSLAATSGGLLGFAGQSGDMLFGAILNAVKRDTGSNVLSTPSVLTLDNEKASILVGQEIPITTGEVLGVGATANPFRTVERKNVGIQLDVKPQINAGGGVTLFLRQEVSGVAGTVSATSNELILNKREIETTVLADDGEIVVLGGLLDQNERLTTQGVPGLSNVPGVGALFRNKRREGGRTNLVVFIRPRIIRSAADARAVTAPRYQDARAAWPGDELERVVREYMQASPPVAPTLPPKAATPTS
jgi:general secretion pathway protein D